MNFDEFQSQFVNENKKLKIIISIMIIVFGVGTAFNIFERRYYLYQGGEIFEERPLSEEICRMGFLTLAEGEPNPHVVSTEILKLVEKEPFSITVDKILMVKSLEHGACKLILKSDGKILAFKILLEGNDKNPFYFKLIQMDEVPANQEII